MLSFGPILEPFFQKYGQWLICYIVIVIFLYFFCLLLGKKNDLFCLSINYILIVNEKITFVKSFVSDIAKEGENSYL